MKEFIGLRRVVKKTCCAGMGGGLPQGMRGWVVAKENQNV